MEKGQIREKAICRRDFLKRAALAGATFCVAPAFGKATAAKKADRMILACQIAMESNMFGYNELESILINREDEKYHVQMEGPAPELTPKHRNLRGKDYFNSKNIDKNDK